MAFVQAHFSSAHSSRRLDFRRQDTRANNTLSEPARRLHREWPSHPSNHEESIGASRQNILRTEERGLLSVWTDFNRGNDSESPDDGDENYSYQIILCERKLC